MQTFQDKIFFFQQILLAFIFIFYYTSHWQTLKETTSYYPKNITTTEKIKINTNIPNCIKFQASEVQGGTGDQHLYKAVLQQQQKNKKIPPPSEYFSEY